MTKLFGAKSNVPKHEHCFVRVCIWNLEHNDCDGEAWDGAYVYYCPGCSMFEPEIKWPDIYYRPDMHFIHRIDGKEWDDSKDRSKWVPVQQWRSKEIPLAA